MKPFKTFTVTNIDDIKALVRQAYSTGTELSFHRTEWLNGQRQPIAKTFIFDTDFEISVENTESLDGYKSILCEVY
jgi:hypothetical protein